MYHGRYGPKRARHGWRRRLSRPRNAATLVVLAILVGAAVRQMSTGSSPLYSALSPSCTIRGNVSATTGERIYHVPGQRFYDATSVKPGRGERWFCSEEEARQAGWRRARS
jgi:hypothetical protein